MILEALALFASATAAPPPVLDAVTQTRLAADLRCHLGAYALPDGRFVTVTGSAGATRTLGYVLDSGAFGSAQERAPGVFGDDAVTLAFAPCATGTVAITRGGISATGTRLGLIQRDTTFTSDGISLHGRLVLPPGGHAEALVVWIEGSNNNPSTDDATWTYELARRGIGVFVYDKRGTGGSGGALTSDFHARARDTAAAVQAARRMAPQVARVGLMGASQGGWVGPIAATLTPVDFVITAFGLAESPIGQDKALVELQLRQAGYGADVLAQARILTSITETIVRSNLEDGFAQLEAFKAAHADAPWLAAIAPRSYTGLFLRFSSEDIRTHGPALAQGLTFDHEPAPLLTRLGIRQLWLLAGKDQQAPGDVTQSVLRDLQQAHHPVSVVVFPEADHGLIEPARPAGPDPVAQGSMVFSPRQFDIAAHWVRTGVLPHEARFLVLGANNAPGR